MPASVKKVAEVIGVLAIIAAGIVWLMSVLESKASTARADALEGRQRATELEAASFHSEVRARLVSIEATVAAIAQRVGAIVPSPNP